MSRSRGFASTIIRSVRAAQRAQAAAARAAIRAQRQVEHSRRVDERYRLADAREHKRIYLESRQAEVEHQNADLQHTVAALNSILWYALARDSSLDLDTLKEPLPNEPFQPGNLAHALSVPELSQYLPPSPGWFMRLVPGTKARHERESAEAQRRFECDLIVHADDERQRQEKLEQARAAHEAKIGETRRRVEAQHAEVEELKHGLQTRAADAVAAYFTLVLGRSEYPEGFPGSSDMTYEPGLRLLAIDMDLPTFDVVPDVGSFKYVKARDEITESSRSAKERRGLYASVIAQTALRTLHEVFLADKASQTVDTVAFNGYVNGIDRGTGQHVRPILVSVRASPDVLASFDLRHVDPAACLHALHGVLSKRPEELAPVEPIFEFNVSEAPVKKNVKP